MMETPGTQRAAKSQLLPIESTACGKAIILGEHGAVYGAHAVVVPLLQSRFRFRLSALSTRLGQPHEIHIKLAGHEGSPRLQGVVSKALELLGIEPFSILGETSSNLPIGAGMGSSATLCVAVLRALSRAADIDLPPAQLAMFANELEKSFHGNPSGLDTAAVAFEKPILFAKGKKIEEIRLSDKPLDFVLIDSTIRASTIAMIRIAEPYFTDPAQGAARIARFDSCSLAGHRALENGDARGLADAMNDCGVYLKEAGVVTPLLEDIITRSREMGLLSAKTTGSGGGGMVIGLLDPEHVERQLAGIQEQFQGHACYRVRLGGGDDSHVRWILNS